MPQEHKGKAPLKAKNLPDIKNELVHNGTVIAWTSFKVNDFLRNFSGSMTI
jgi:hypothetical protein